MIDDHRILAGAQILALHPLARKSQGELIGGIGERCSLQTD